MSVTKVNDSNQPKEKCYVCDGYVVEIYDHAKKIHNIADQVRNLFVQAVGLDAVQNNFVLEYVNQKYSSTCPFCKYTVNKSTDFDKHIESRHGIKNFLQLVCLRKIVE